MNHESRLLVRVRYYTHFKMLIPLHLKINVQTLLRSFLRNSVLTSRKNCIYLRSNEPSIFHHDVKVGTNLRTFCKRHNFDILCDAK